MWGSRQPRADMPKPRTVGGADGAAAALLSTLHGFPLASEQLSPSARPRLQYDRPEWHDEAPRGAGLRLCVGGETGPLLRLTEPASATARRPGLDIPSPSRPPYAGVPWRERLMPM
ncbi:hypothetical protein GCM10010317_076460 [Streptomyces mirabilis]|nr:hypothetical protein GCM10010317_076460 [Streptomyces mirabilis]